ncbi:MAG TPA: YueI family protein [Candidatus Limosilactobacillus merdigallinarum]|uniref:YueI family protein n=1 Tax=Candidatus Limosilactobacillus merdigallinarum TaxID=2838652 RepID=A0A9D2AKL4_9LACO|nr:YueI family protein [Candidatus Limosilactobacillus merdigallinarum]
MVEHNDDVNERLKNEIYGQPKIKPDEQRRYMGTFRERVWLTISIQEIQEQDWTTAFQKELQKHPDCLVIINGNLDDNYTSKYLAIANQLKVDFTIKTGSDIKTGADNLAIVLTDLKAVFANPVDIAKLYGQSDQDKHQSSKKHESFLQHLFHN